MGHLIGTIQMNLERLRQVEVDKERQLEELLQDGEQNTFDETTLYHRLNKFYLEFSATFCHIDLLAHADNNSSSSFMTTSTSTHELRPFGRTLWRFFNVNRNSQGFNSSQWRQVSRRKLWPYLITLTWLACVVNIIYYLYHQYTYDIYSFKLSRQRWLKQTRERKILEEHNKLIDEKFLEQQLEVQGRRLKGIGAPFMHMNFVVESVYVATVLAPFILYVLSGLYYTWSSPFNFYFIRNFYDFKHERVRSEQFVRAQVKKFINSCDNYSISTWQRQFHHMDIQFKPSAAQRFRAKVSCRQLNELLLAGQLRPLNQKTDVIRKQSFYFACVILPSSFYAFCYNICFTCLMLIYLDKPLNELRLADWLPHCELMVLIIVCEVSTIFYVTAGVFTCLDQVFLVSKLRKLLKLVVQLNDLRSYKRHKQLVIPSTGNKLSNNLFMKGNLNLNLKDNEMCKNQLMNGNILLVLMHYRIFVAHFSKLRNSLSIIASTMVFIMFMMPIVSRLHFPYMASSMRPIIVAICCLIILPLDVCLLPFCHLNKRCLDLYRELNYLLAHTIDISQQQQQPNQQDTFDHHIVSIIRKSLSHPEAIVEQLAIKTKFFPNITYENIVRLHFYVGFIILSIVGDNGARKKDLTGTIFTDPLGLF